MSATLSYRPGALVRHGEKECVILEAVSSGSVLIEETTSKRHEVVPVSSLKSITPDDNAKPDRTLDELSPEDLAEAKRRLGLIKPLVRSDRRSRADVEAIATANNLSITTIYDWIKRYEGRRRVSDLAPNRKGREMPKKLSSEVDAIVSAVIDKLYLSKHKGIGKKVHQEAQRCCRAANLTAPSINTIYARLRAIPPQERVLKREGRKAAHDKFGNLKGSFPGVDAPLAVVQIDHTLLDIMVVDEEMKIPIGRPWLTLAIDCYSRMIFGYHLSLDHPSAFAIGLCLIHGMLDKSEELQRLGIKGEWPVWGKPRKIHADNGKDFRSYLIEDTLDQYDICYDFRPVKTPHYGGHIERVCGTLGKEIHALPGTTFSNPKARGEYKSEAKAVMTLSELRRWLVQLIVGVYHNRVHRGIDCPPLAKWNEGIIGSDKVRGAGLPEPIQDARQLRLDFLPFEQRTVQREGIVWDKIWYRDPLLTQWVKLDEGRQSRKYKVRRDPTDISKLYFLDPALGQYVEIPYRNYGHPSISLWEYRAAEAWLRRQGKLAENEEAIFEAYEEMHRITEDAARQTKRTRREQAKRKELTKHRSGLTLDPAKAKRDVTMIDPAKPKPGRKEANRLELVVNNAGQAKSNDFDFSDAEITEGIEKW